MDRAVRNGQRLARLEGLLRLAVWREPELALDDLRHDDTRMVVAAGLKPAAISTVA
jgi:hypothetical protein